MNDDDPEVRVTLDLEIFVKELKQLEENSLDPLPVNIEY